MQTRLRPSQAGSGHRGPLGTGQGSGNGHNTSVSPADPVGDPRQRSRWELVPGRNPVAQPLLLPPAWLYSILSPPVCRGLAFLKVTSRTG